MKELLEIEVTDEEFDYLLCQQNQGKELKVVDNKVVAVEHEVTQEELNLERISYIKEELKKLSEDFTQYMLGAEFEDIEARKQKFRDLHNELRSLENKEPRIYKNI